MPYGVRNPNIFAQAKTVAQEKRHCKGTMFEFKDPATGDLPYSQLQRNRSQIKAVCMMGAIMYAGWRLHWPWHRVNAAILWADRFFGRSQSMVLWSDSKETQKQDVVMKLGILASQSERERPSFMEESKSW
jgi:hypothetical protein